ERSKLEWIVEQAQEGYLILNQQDEILYANPQARKYLHILDSQEFNNKKFLEFARLTYVCTPELSWENWPENTNLVRHLIRPETKDEKAILLQVGIVNDLPTTSNSKLVKLHDVTKKIVLQNDIWKFHAVIEHKLRTPIACLLGSLDFIVTMSSNNPEIEPLATIAFEGAKRLSTQLEDILQYVAAPDLARAGKEFYLTNLHRVIKEIADSLELKNINIENYEELNGYRFILSHQATELILKEVLENSKKFHPTEEPKIDIILQKVDAKHISIEICDDGVNLSYEQLVQVWQPYHQVEKLLTGQLAGMGLGLSTIATLMWKTGSSCYIYNRENAPGIVVKLVFLLQD
ncbi:MAG: putative two-component response regulator, partial [bacterium]